ncbi:ABC transporter ATP-binding protein [Hellea balneolensis]|uniref:ABC transporter ATP-binding protein n=1 Tax=Hellea balneolensis TaxID=287478 RepID=UPI000426AC90|nr:ABC transporter ATP-binding protein [Hellea balneolensis]
MISFEKLSSGYGPCDVLQSVSAIANPGVLIALIGPNGCGKSTLLKTLCGLITASSGEIDIGGKNLSDLPLKARAKTLAYLAQSREALPSMTVEEVVQLGRAPYRGGLGKISAEGKAAISSALARTHSDVFKTRRFDSLSGGEQARVLLARALAVEAPVMLADEPIAALDPYYQLSMMQILKAEALSGNTVITALHDLSLAAQFADHIWMMHQGKIIADGKPNDVLNAENLKTVFGVKLPKGGFKALELSA